MPAVPRALILEDESIFHVMWQCHNKSWLLQTNWAKRLYYNLLLKYKDRYKVDIYSYCLMDNHIHLSGRLDLLTLFSAFFRTVNSTFARIYNQEMKRRGQVVMDRFKSPRIETDTDLLKVMLYIDLNPKRATKVEHPRDNDFSSFAYYAYGQEDSLITPAPSYVELGSTAKRRQKAYQHLINEILLHDWKDKRPYSSQPFIGNPNWIIKKTEALKQVQRDKRLEWQKRFKAQFLSAA